MTSLRTLLANSWSCQYRWIHLGNHLAKVWHSTIKMLAMLLWLDIDSIGHCLQLSASDSLEKVADFSAIIDTTIIMICKALHYCVLFFAESDVIVLMPSAVLTIIVSVLQLSLCNCVLPGHIVRAKKMLMNVEVHSLTVQASHTLFYINICINVCKDHWDSMIEALSILKVSHCYSTYFLWSQSWVWRRFDFASTMGALTIMHYIQRR